jgi:hypothetical protein
LGGLLLLLLSLSPAVAERLDLKVLLLGRIAILLLGGRINTCGSGSATTFPAFNGCIHQTAQD